MSIFGWLRRGARDAVLGGVQDAAQVLSSDEAMTTQSLDNHREQFAKQLKALPAPPTLVDEEKGRRKQSA